MNLKTVDRFHVNLLSLSELMIDIVPNDFEGISIGVLDLGKAHLDSWEDEDKEKAINDFIENTHKYWTTLIAKKASVFLVEQSPKIFSYFGNYADVFKKLFLDEKAIKKDDITLIWKYMTAFVKQSIKYIHEKREPLHKIINNHYMPIYNHKYMEHIDVPQYAKFWEVNLEWPPSKHNPKPKLKISNFD